MHKCNTIAATLHRRLHSSVLRRHHATLHIPTREVTDHDIARLASSPLHPLTLRDLVKHGNAPLSTEQLLQSANFALSILPSRLAHRIQSLRSLPYIVVASPNVSAIHTKYVHSLSTLLPYAEKRIHTLEEEIHFTEVMADLVQTHSNTISVLAQGFLESRRYISPTAVTRFLDEHLRARIGTRLIAEQHIALHFSSKPHANLMARADGPSNDLPHMNEEHQQNHVGVIDMDLRPADVIRSCESLVGDICELNYGIRPTVTIDGEADTTISHVPMHLEYVITELLKNSFRATIENRTERVPIVVTIAPAPGNDLHITEDAHKAGVHAATVQGASDRASKELGWRVPDHSNIKPLSSPDHSTPGVTIRIRDRGGGISPANMRKLWDYGFTTFSEDQILDKISGGADGRNGITDDAMSTLSGVGGSKSSLAGLGYGLPLGRAYAEYFGGGIAVQSLWGWGTDVYLHLRGVGKLPWAP